MYIFSIVFALRNEFVLFFGFYRILFVYLYRMPIENVHINQQVISFELIV